MSELTSMSMFETLEALEKKQTSSLEVTRAYLDRIERIDPDLNAYISVRREKALEEAAKADSERARGEKAPLLGIPIALKDLICVEGEKTTCASKILENFIAPYDAFALKKLKSAGAILLGKTNLDQFAMGSSCETSHFGPTRNPWDKERSPGGSSGGSAAAVAADLCVGALGSDTGGSIRQPAAFCGVVGLKPTYGLVSRFGLIAFASSLDQIGPITKTVADSAAMLNVIAGRDPNDSTSASVEPEDYGRLIGESVKGMKIGAPREYLELNPNEHIRASVEKSIEALEENGAKVEEISLPHTEYGIPTYYIIATAEASSNLARFDGIRYGHRTAAPTDSIDELFAKTRAEGFGEEVKRRIMLGTYALSSGYYDAYYLKAQKARALITDDFTRAFEKVDFIIAPTTPDPAFKIGERIGDALSMYLSDIFTVNLNLAALPGISVCSALSPDRLPIGTQLIGPHFSEARLIQLADALERTMRLDRKPPLDGGS